MELLAEIAWREAIARFIDAALQYPTVLFSFLVALLGIYWLFVVLGTLDLDFLSFDLGDAGVDGIDGVDAGADADVGGAGKLLGALGLGDVPITLPLTAFSLVAWLATATGTRFLGPRSTSLLWGTLLLAGGVGAGIAGAALLVRPLRPLFRTIGGTRKQELVGKVCEILTLRANDRYGQAELRDGGSSLLVQVRTTAPGEELHRGERAIIFAYDVKEDVFHVKTLGTGSADELF